jgi:hypothetical protein
MNQKTARSRRKLVVMVLSCVFMDWAAEHESASVAHNVRNTIKRFYEERKNSAAIQFDALHEDPGTTSAGCAGHPRGSFA